MANSNTFDVGMDFPIAAWMYTTNYDGGDCVIRTDSGINSLEVDWFIGQEQGSVLVRVKEVDCIGLYIGVRIEDKHFHRQKIDQELSLLSPLIVIINRTGVFVLRICVLFLHVLAHLLQKLHIASQRIRADLGTFQYFPKTNWKHYLSP